MIKRALILFYFIWYLMPSIHSLINPLFYKELFKGEVSYVSLIYTAIFFLLAYYFSKVNFGFLKIKQFSFLGVFFNKKVEWVFVLIFLVTSYIFYFEYGFQFRHTGQGLSDAGPILYINYITKTYIKLFIFKYIIIACRENYKAPFLKLSIVLIGSFFSMSSALDVMPIIFTLILMFKKDLLYLNLSKHLISSILVLLSSVIFIPLIGVANKVGYEQALITIQDNYLFFIETIIRRIGTWHQSINVYITIIKSDVIYDPSDTIINIVKTLFNRVEIIFGGVREIPKIQSIFRLNFLNLFNDTSNVLSGASPGIVATSLLFYFPVGLIIFSLLLGQLYRYLFSMISKKINFLTHIFILFVMVMPIVSSPIDLINIISPSTFFILFLISLRKNIKKQLFKPI
tara:strand:+ start:965 stop:2164 length:1200 start_codon:yes stop_codon:yes gene_type:complete